MAKLQPELLHLLDGDLFHEQAREYLESEGCVSVGLFRNWVDCPSEWSALLESHDPLGVLKRAHVAHIKECWERATRRDDAAPPARRAGRQTGAASPTTRPTAPLGPPRDALAYDVPGMTGDSPTWQATGEQAGDANFWTGLISSRVSTFEMRSIANLTVGDLCDLLAGSDDTRTNQAFDRFDTDGDGHITRSELRAALEFLGFRMNQDCGDQIFNHLALRAKADDAAAEEVLTPKVFQFMLKRMRLAELFTPTAGVFKWDEREAVSSCSITAVDYDAEHCRVSEPLTEGEDGVIFFFGCRKPFPATTRGFTGPVDQPPVRWVHVNAMKGLDRLTFLRLAVKYGVHPLAVDDVLDSRTSTKVDRYGNDYVVCLDILCVVNRDTGSAEPPRVRIHRSHVTIFLIGPPKRDTLMTIHQERGDKSSWLQMWACGSDEESSAESGDLWKGMLSDLKRGRGGTGVGAERRMPPMRMREERADFLLYEVLHRVVQQIRPIAEAYAKRLGWMRQRPIQYLTQECMDEVQQIKLEIYDFVRSIRPLKQVVKHFTDEDAIGPSARMYMEDVSDAIESTMMDIGQLTNIAEALESAHVRYNDKKTNDTLFALSLLSGIFLPMQFFTGWYGMNFADMPELTWEYGYQYFWALEILCLVVSILGIAWLRDGRYLTPLRSALHCPRRGKVQGEATTETEVRPGPADANSAPLKPPQVRPGPVDANIST